MNNVEMHHVNNGGKKEPVLDSYQDDSTVTYSSLPIYSGLRITYDSTNILVRLVPCSHHSSNGGFPHHYSHCDTILHLHVYACKKLIYLQQRCGQAAFDKHSRHHEGMQMLLHSQSSVLLLEHDTQSALLQTCIYTQILCMYTMYIYVYQYMYMHIYIVV